MKKIEKTAESKNFTAVNVGKMNDLAKFTLTHPVSQRVIEGKVFLKDATHATATEISYNFLPAKTEVPYSHTHNKNEETYLILSGSGMFQVDDDCFAISEGSVVRVSPAGKRGMTNTSDEGMVYVVIQAKENSIEEYSSEDGNMTEVEPAWNK